MEKPSILEKELLSPPSDRVVEVDVPPAGYLMFDGQGEPGGADFQSAFGVLYGVSFTIKMMPKKGMVPPGYHDYKMAPLEGLWWSDEGMRPKTPAGWHWTLMIAQPDFVTAELVAEAADQLRQRRNPPGLERLQFEIFDEGRCVQIMHVGPYAEEEATIGKLMEYCEQHGLEIRGKHHEIYLGDPLRTKPEKLKTILRYSVA